MKLIRRLVLAAALAAVPAAGSPLPARADVTGAVGDWAVVAMCGDRSRLGIASMDISASLGASVPGVSTTGAQRLQWFAFQATLYYAPAGSSWTFADAQSWRGAWVTDPISNPLTNMNNWYDYATGQWNAPFPSWNLYSPGTYAIWLNMWWFADARSGWGHVSTWAPVTNGVVTGWLCS